MFRGIVATVTTISFLSAILIAPPLAAFAQDTPEETPEELPQQTLGACAQAEQDVDTHHSAAGYGVGGFLCGIFGFAFASISQPKVPAESIAGKDADFVAMYTQCYQNKAKSKNVRASCIGWAIGAPIAIAIVAASGNE